jgi:hypothetical protein
MESALAQVRIHQENPHLVVDSNMLLLRDRTIVIHPLVVIVNLTIPAAVTMIGPSGFTDCDSLITIDGRTSQLEIIEAFAFHSCQRLREISFPSSIRILKHSCFAGCSSLSSVVFEFPSHMEEIGQFAFALCNSLIEFALPQNVVTISEYAFLSCATLSQFHISAASSLQRILSNAFNQTAIQEFRFPHAIQSIEARAFPSECVFKYSIEAQQMALFHWLSALLLDPDLELTPQHFRQPRDIADYAITLDNYHDPPDPCEFPIPSDFVREVRLYEHNETNAKIVVTTYRKPPNAAQNAILEEEAMHRAVAMIRIHHLCVVPLAGYCPLNGHIGLKIAIPYIGSDSLESVFDSEEFPDWWTETTKTIVIIGIVVGMHLIHSAGYRH